MKKYDSVIFGNGFNCAVSYEMSIKCADEYKYLFNLESFLNRLYDYEMEKMPSREKTLYTDKYLKMAEDMLVKSNKGRLVSLCDRLSYYYALEQPIKLICNIETRLVELTLGFFKKVCPNFMELACAIAIQVADQNIVTDGRAKRLLTNREYKEMREYLERLDSLLADIYRLYNIHDAIQNLYILKNPELESVRKKYYSKFMKLHMKKNAIYMTTNYGLEIKEYYPRIEYLHGCFVDCKVSISDAGEVLKGIDIKDEKGIYKFFFGASSINKHYALEDGIYDDAFFLGAKCKKGRHYGNMLIFGMSFAKIYGNLENFYPEERKFDMHIDSHIMKTIDELFASNRLKTVTIVAYSEDDKQNYVNLLESYKSCDVVNIGNLYDMNKIKIISEEEFRIGRKRHLLVKRK